MLLNLNFLKLRPFTRVAGKLSKNLVLTKKIHILKKELRGWNKNIFGNVSINVTKAKDALSSIQQQLKDGDALDEVLESKNFLLNPIS